VEAQSCLYTTTPDERFVLERRGRVVVCSACSGHGFKFAPVLGEITADLALDGGTARVIDLFAPARLVSRTPPS
jgi:sarcosine oxidase